MKQKKSFFQSMYDVKMWMEVYINHRNHTRNLILTLAIAMLAFACSQYDKLKGGNIRDTRIAIVLFGISSYAGLYMAMQQSVIYRLYRNISEIIEQTPEMPDEEIDDNVFEKEKNKLLSIETLDIIVFRFQLGALFSGIAFISSAFF